MPGSRIGPLARRAVAITAAAAWCALTRAPLPPVSAVAADSAVYDVQGGRSVFVEKSGVRLLQLFDGVTIVHRDVTITAERGVHDVSRGRTRLEGDVRIRQGRLRMRGDRGRYVRRSELAFLDGAVRIVDRGWTVDADALEYRRVDGVLWLRGNVFARDSTSSIRADSLFYDRERGRAEAFGAVEIRDRGEGIAVRGKHAWYFRDRHEALVDRLPHAVIDPEAPEPVTVDADTMRVYPDSGLARAYYRVKIIKGNTVTQCDSAVWYDEASRVDLFGHPLARQDNVTMRSRRMEITYNEREVERMDLVGDAEIVEANRDALVVGRDSWVRGDTIRLFTSRSDIDSMRVVGNARSEYHPVTPGKVEKNRVRGVRMFFRFEGDSLRYVRVEGPADGVYRYVDLVPGVTVDSLRAVADSTLRYVSFDSLAETVEYRARRIEYYADTSDLVLEHDAMLEYRGSRLKGGRITYLSRYELLDAVEDPELFEDGQTFYGHRMNYDMDAGTGLVKEGSTQFQDGYYSGETVAQVQGDQMKVWNSTYTTCDLAKPHFHFQAREMKLFPNDKVVSGPIWLYIGDTPVFYLPFMASSLRRGRRSGFLRPDFDFGISSREGRFIRNVGYYWATNDYTDFTLLADFNERASLRGFVRNVYRKRYLFDGSAEFNFFRDLRDYTNRWEVRWRHTQQKLPWGISGRADAHFVSSDDAPGLINRIDNVDRVTDRRIESNASLTKAFGRSVRLNATARRVQNLNLTSPTGVRLDMTMPSVTLSIPSRNLFFGTPSREGHQGLLEQILSDIRYSPSLRGVRTVRETQQERREVVRVDQGLSFSSSPRIGFVTVSPRLSLSNQTVRTVVDTFAHTETAGTTSVFVPPSTTRDTENTFSWSAGAQASTNLYGTFYPRVGRLRGIRHVVSPVVGWSFRPSTGGRPSDQTVTLSLRNTVDLKVATGDSTGQGASREEQLRKISNVLNWTLSTTYDPDAPSNRAWSTIQSRIGVQVAGLSVNYSQTIDPYTWEFTSHNASAGLRLSGAHPFGRVLERIERRRNVVARHDTTRADTTAAPAVEIVQGGAGAGRPVEATSAVDLDEGRLPWSLRLDASFSQSRFGDPRASLHVNGHVDLTAGWKLDYSMVYDVTGRRRSGERISVVRDLHCWQASFTRQKLGDEWQFYFRIAIKALPEIFYETGRRGLGGGTLGTGTFF